MKEKIDCPIGSLIFFCFLLVMFGFCIAGRIWQPSDFKRGDEIKSLKQQAITLGYAEYNQTNGIWQWKTNSVLEKSNYEEETK